MSIVQVRQYLCMHWMGHNEMTTISVPQLIDVTAELTSS